MRIIVLLSLVLAACEHHDAAEKSAELVAKAAGAAPREPVSTMAPAVSVGAADKMVAPSCGGSCGGGQCGGSCGGMACGGSCGGGDQTNPTWAAIPNTAAWTDLHVAGMHCGGCARRIERALAKLDGVIGVKVDLGTASVKVATARTDVATKLGPSIKATIDGLGYQVQ